MLSLITASDIVEEYLREHKFDGLFHEDGGCGCLLEDLNPCGHIGAECHPGYKVKCRCGDDCDFDVAATPDPVEPQDHPFFPEFIEECIDIDWHKMSRKDVLSEEFIRYYKDKVNWLYISEYQKLSESFIEEFQDLVNWNSISYYQKLSEGFIRKFKDRVAWTWICESQTLSEDFIREFQDEVDWYNVSWKQKLSEPFIREFVDKVNWLYLAEYQELSEDFIEEFKDRIRKVV